MRLAIIPAAGRSSRLGRSKALVSFRGSVVLEVIAGLLRRGGAERLVAVAAAGDETLVDRCGKWGLDVAVNHHPQTGMLGSIQIGIRHATPRDSDLVIICPVDFPAVHSATIRALYAAVDERAAPTTAVPVCDERRGHPLALSGALVPEIQTLDPKVGLRELLDRHPPIEVPVDDRGIHSDLDDWTDYARLLS